MAKPLGTNYEGLAAKAKVQKPKALKITTIPSRGHSPEVLWEYPEFQSICPVSKRHDQANVVIRYKVKDSILESKAVRDYLTSWRNVQCWQEYVTEEIADKLYKACDPEWLTVEIEWSPRGGIYSTTSADRG